MKQNQDRSKAISLLFEAVAWSMGGIFLLTLTTASISLWLNQIVGWLFITFSVFLIIASFRNNLVPWGDKIRVYLAYPLFAVTVTHFITTAFISRQSIYVILAIAFLLFLLAAIVFQNVKILKETLHRRRF